MTNAENLTVKLNENDNVATALREINAGESTQNLQSINKIPKRTNKPCLNTIEVFPCDALKRNINPNIDKKVIAINKY